jgi:hypothetical protein
MTTTKCQTCGNTWEWHEKNSPRHPFNDGSMGASVTFKKKHQQNPSVVPSSMPFDPVLRQALINKGVLTVEDLRDAEAQISVVTNLFTRESNDPKGGANNG